MGEYDRTGNGQSSKTDWDLRSILCDIAKNWWVILLIACSAAMITYTVMATVHKDRYTVKTTFAVMGRGVDANAASSLSATYEMAQKFEAILENTILKKKVMEELSLSSFPAKMNASIVPESNLMELSVTADSPEMAFRILKSVLNNYTSISDYIIPNVVLETLQQPQVSGVPSNQIPTKKYAATAFLAAALAMAALIGLFSFLRDTVKNEAEFTRKIDADLLGVVYHEKKKKNSSMLITNPARSFLYVESLKRIASRVRGRLDRKGGKVLLVTSVAENEGKSTLAANLALALAEEQNRVLLLDCDFRQPALHKIFEIPEKDGKDFGKVVLGKESASGVFEKHKDTNVYTGICRNRLEEPSLAIGGEIFHRILETCRTNMDYIILDGVPSPMVWEKYVKYRSLTDNSDSFPQHINLRNKESGWSHYAYSVKFAYADKKRYLCKNGDDPFMQLFVKDYILRESCSSCHFKGYHRVSDITLGDFWGIWNINPKMDDNKGTSLILTHTAKGEKMMNAVSENIKCEQVYLEQAARENPSLLRSSVHKQNRDIVLKTIESENFQEILPLLQVKQPQRRSKKEIIKRVLKKLCGLG